MLVHVYGVTAAGVELPEGLAGRAGTPIRTVADDRLQVLVSDVEDDARVGRKDLLAHAHALESLAASETVVPMQFGVLMPDDETVRSELVDRQGAHLLALLQAFEGMVQLTVTATYEEAAALGEVVAREPSLKQSGPMELDARIRLGEAVAAGLERLRQEDGGLIADRLARHAQAVAINEPRGAYDVASIALLVRREDQDAVGADVAELREAAGDRMEFRYVGPQPPYDFLDTVVAEGSRWG